jgi:single-strand DNA-binding protein
MIKLQIIGNIGNDCIVRDVNGYKSINFSVAENQKYTKDGVTHEKTNWVNCSIWRESDQNTNISQYLKKGCKVFVEGTPTVKLFDGQNGKQASLELRVNVIELLTFPEKTDESVESEKVETLPTFAEKKNKK